MRLPRFVYAIHAQTTDSVKIGQSANPHERLGQLQTGIPFPLMLVCMARYDGLGCQKLEQFLLDDYGKSLVRGEWVSLAFAKDYQYLTTDFSERITRLYRQHCPYRAAWYMPPVHAVYLTGAPPIVPVLSPPIWNPIPSYVSRAESMEIPGYRIAPEMLWTYIMSIPSLEFSVEGLLPLVGRPDLNIKALRQVCNALVRMGKLERLQKNIYRRVEFPVGSIPPRRSTLVVFRGAKKGAL